MLFQYEHRQKLHKFASTADLFLVASESTRAKLPHPQNRYGSIVEFVTQVNYPGADTFHWFFDLDELKLVGSPGNPYHDVKAVYENLIVYPRWVNGGTNKIIIHDMFERDKDRRELTGDFSETQEEKFLLAAEFTTVGKLSAEYIGKDGQVHSEIFSLD